MANPDQPAEIVVQSDASSGWGCGAIKGNKWLLWRRSEDWANIQIMKELVPIVLNCAVVVMSIEKVLPRTWLFNCFVHYGSLWHALIFQSVPCRG